MKLLHPKKWGLNHNNHLIIVVQREKRKRFRDKIKKVPRGGYRMSIVKALIAIPKFSKI